MLLDFKICVGLPLKYDFCYLRRIQMEIKHMLCIMTSLKVTVFYNLHGSLHLIVELVYIDLDK